MDKYLVYQCSLFMVLHFWDFGSINNARKTSARLFKEVPYTSDKGITN